MKIVSRADWGGPKGFVKADGSPGAYHVPLSKRTGVCLHWDGGSAVLSYPYDKVMAKLQEQHRLVEGGSWGGVGYSYVITGDGRIWEGRGLMLTSVACPDRNTAWFHVQIHAGKGDPAPTAAQLRSAAWLAGWLDQKAGRKLTRHVHSDGYPTECAGKKITEWVRAGMPVPEGTDIDQEEDPLAQYSRQDLTDIVQKAWLGIKWGDQTVNDRFTATYRNSTFIPVLAQQLGEMAAALKAIAEDKLTPEQAAALGAALDRNTAATHDLVRAIGLDREETPA